MKRGGKGQEMANKTIKERDERKGTRGRQEEKKGLVKGRG